MMSRAGNDHSQDAKVRHALDALAPYVKSHPNAIIEVCPQYDLLIRIRIIDPDFQEWSLDDREWEIWPLLKPLPEDVFECITMLLLLTPEETPKSPANFEFENSVPSRF